MSEAEELKAFKQKLDAKYGRLAKKRLAKLSKMAHLKKQLIDMTDEEFNQQLNRWFPKKQPKDNQVEQQQQDHNTQQPF